MMMLWLFGRRLSRHCCISQTVTVTVNSSEVLHAHIFLLTVKTYGYSTWYRIRGLFQLGLLSPVHKCSTQSTVHIRKKQTHRQTGNNNTLRNSVHSLLLHSSNGLILQLCTVIEPIIISTTTKCKELRFQK